MPRYIDADEITYFQLAIYGDVTTKYRIDHIPTADVREVKHGHWVNSWDGAIICSVCGEENPVHLMQNFPFCPYCSAKLDEEEEHEDVSFDEEKEAEDE